MKILAKQFLIALAIVSLCACSDDDNGAPAPPPVTDESQRPTPDGQQAPNGSGEAGDGEISVARIESQLPPVTALDTFGGQLIAGYLQGALSGPQVVNQTFEEDDFVLSNMAEMSMAIRQLRQEGNFDAQDETDIKTLEGAMTQFLNDKIRKHSRLEDILEYGTAAGLGVLGGVYSDEILRGLGRLWNTPLFQAPANGVRKVYYSLRGSPEKISGWLGRQGKRVKETDPVAKTVDKSNDLYLRSIAYMQSKGRPITTKEQVLRHMVRVFGSPQLPRGIRVVDIPKNELTRAKRLPYKKVNIPGFRVHRKVNDDFFTVKIKNLEGDFDYYYVKGSGVKATLTSGEEVTIPPKTLTDMAASRLESYGDKTVTFLTTSGQKITTGVRNSSAYQFAARHPRALRATAVGTTTGLMSLLLLRPIDTRYITLEDYVQDLEQEGIHIEDFLDNQRVDAQTEANVQQQPVESTQ